MTSNKKFKNFNEAFVWIWLPGETEPVVAGKIEIEGDVVSFLYGRTYLGRPNAISIFTPELPLQSGIQYPNGGLSIAGCIRDASPDAWGRRVILNRMFEKKINSKTQDPLNEITYLLESGSDRIGALDFQESATNYVPRAHKNASLDELLSSAERVEKGVLLTPELDSALHHGSSIGGARPKALIDDGTKKYIAKFSSTSDEYSVVKAEYVAMRLADIAKINVAPVKLKRTSGKDVLLIERFDRVRTAQGFERKSMLSALTLFSLDEMMTRYASYQDLCEIIRTKFKNPKDDLKELFRRLVYNILVGNNDDHARNHAAIWDGRNLSLSPAYDLCPQKRGSRESNQAMLIFNGDKKSQLETCFAGCQEFLLKREEAISIVEELMTSIVNNWKDVIAEGTVTEADEKLMKATQFFNTYAFDDLKSDASYLLSLKKKFA